jgi:DNA processing protein
VSVQPGALPPEAYAVALSLLPGAGPVNLLGLLAGGELREPLDPQQAWHDVLSGRVRRPRARAHGDHPVRNRVDWDVAARRFDVGSVWATVRAARIGVTWWGGAEYPAVLRTDPLPPAVLFWRGSLDSLDGPCVALVGTRHATAEGRALAFEMGRDLARAGVCVVSGLALGIDGASHRGALSVPRQGTTIGVAASGVDRPYPSRHRDLWEEVVASGAVLSETPPSYPPQTWRFPARNRIIAGLVSMVVVVESHAAGGSLITAEAALERGVEVRAVPGPVRSSASAGTNQLLYDGPGPVRDATDILLALGAAVSGDPRYRPTPLRGDRCSSKLATAASSGERGSVLTHAGLLETMGWLPRSLNWIVTQSEGDVPGVVTALEALAAAGWVGEERGWWQRLK